MTIEEEAGADIARLLEYLHAGLDAIRPGARYLITASDERVSIMFCDHGGDLSVTQMARRSGPPKTSTNAPTWRQSPVEQQRFSVAALGGMMADRPTVISIAIPGQVRLEAVPELPASNTGAIDVDGSDTSRNVVELMGALEESVTSAKAARDALRDSQEPPE